MLYSTEELLFRLPASRSMKKKLRILAPHLSHDPVSWVHRVEAHLLKKELRKLSFDISIHLYPCETKAGSPLLLRLSDNLMRRATRELTALGLPYAGPPPGVLENCYDKYTAYRKVSEIGVEIPPTFLGNEPLSLTPPILIKPRRGSDSLGIRVFRSGRVPERFRTEEYLLQPFLNGIDLTVGYLPGFVGYPLEILRPTNTIYSFARKNLLRTKKRPVSDNLLVHQLQTTAKGVCRKMGIDWAARVDFLFDPKHHRLYFLECDAAPLIHRESAFALSLQTAGLERTQQISLFLKGPLPEPGNSSVVS